MRAKKLSLANESRIHGEHRDNLPVCRIPRRDGDDQETIVPPDE